MKATTRRLVIGATAVTMAVSMTACGKAGSTEPDSAGGSGNTTIGVLLPENKTTRYESFDRPLIDNKIHELCWDCDINYSNAAGDTQAQRKQFNALITQGVKVVVLDPVDATATRSWVDQAAKKGVKVVAYDRLAEGDISGYVSYDNVRVGELQGKGMLQALGDEASEARLVMINGSPTGPNAAMFKKGAHNVLDGKVGKIVYEADIPDWSPDQANKKMSAAITALGKDGFDAVYSANDGMASGIATALAKAGIEDVPLGGQDAELAAIQRIVNGRQSFTVYKAIKPEADTAAAMAVALLNGEDVGKFADRKVDSKSDKDIPTKLYDAQIVTKDNIKDTILADKVYTVDQICTRQYLEACKAVGLE
jgi:D-xylose transport system substrate-binding protein